MVDHQHEVDCGFIPFRFPFEHRLSRLSFHALITHSLVVVPVYCETLFPLDPKYTKYIIIAIVRPCYYYYYF